MGTPADVYALGLVLLELITGAPAFGGTATETALARLTHDPVVPEALPAALSRLLVIMTAREPGSRPTAAVVATELGRAARSLSAARAAQVDIDTQAVAIGSPPEWWRRRRSAAVALAGAAALVALGLGIGLLDSGSPAATKAIGAPDPTATSAPRADPPTESATFQAQPAAVKQKKAKHHGGHAAKHHKPKHHGAKPHKPRKPHKHPKPPKRGKPPKHHGH